MTSPPLTLPPCVVFRFSADNGEEFLPNRFVKSCAWAGSYKSLAHYCTRGWCRLEMLLGQTEPLPQDGFMFNFLVPKKKKVRASEDGRRRRASSYVSAGNRVVVFQMAACFSWLCRETPGISRGERTST